MLRQINFYSICFAFGLSVLLILAGSRYTDNANYRPVSESHRNVRNFLRIVNDDEVYQPQTIKPYDDAEKVIELQRLKIEAELSHYNLSGTGHKLKELVPEAGGRPVRSMIVSTWRSGTTFLGEILNAIPGNFYHYEPLLKYDIIQIRGPPHADDALTLLNNMFKCNFHGMDDYFEFGREHSYQFSHNTRLWDHCKYKRALCVDSNFTTRFCKLFPFQSMKVVRLRLRLIEDILQDKELSNLKAVLLVRDPRGAMQSRQHREWCLPAPDCWSPELMCADMISDYVALTRLQKKFPNRVTVVRYEDFSLNVTSETRRLLSFLGLSMSTALEEFLQTHTNKEGVGVSSTFRVSHEVPFKWRNVLKYEYVSQIQDVCSEAMELWGYRPAHNRSHMQSEHFVPIGPYRVAL
ncbi:hypothetical protein JYU34_010986 [Plutella xylostella]|uniref:Uncharacterized protein n=2 Tax=Plutella xylostella TaxID=51655 RepID=A0ABQ7QFR8_PLUXY|nr:hypothetical protein JYU34_010986 [Plutella xylostella]CAG9110438.1 unnamed protein product [Plutella xylostella]